MGEDSEQDSHDDNDDDEEDISEDEMDVKPTVKPYHQLIQSLQPMNAVADDGDGERRTKRRKMEEAQERKEEEEEEREVVDEENMETPGSGIGDDDDEEEEDIHDIQNVQDEVLDDDIHDDPYEVHFATEENELSRRLEALKSGKWNTSKKCIGKTCTMTRTAPQDAPPLPSITDWTQLALKDRLRKNKKNKKNMTLHTDLDQTLTSHIFTYTDVLTSTSTPSLRPALALHAVNHILKGRDKVLKNTSRLRHNPDAGVEFRDQGFTRPKVLILTETRQAAHAFATQIVNIFSPDQQENRKRFDDAFTAPVDATSTMPEDYQQLFGGNNDNSFLTALKFTRKTLKFYSAFYTSDIILASPLGLRRVIENEDVKKRDHDFLSSIEVVIVDQLSASYMQSWENVDTVFSHLNLELKESHGCDFSRVRNTYLDGNSSSLRQTILLTEFITPEMQRLYNSLTNIAGRTKISHIYRGEPLSLVSSLSIKQTFTRFPSPSPITDPDSRFHHFTTAVLPTLLRQSSSSGGGTLLFIPSYYDFLRLRNFFATSSQTEHISFGTIHDYSDISAQRRARSHFASGRHSVLLYTERAHHFYRLRIRGVKRVVCYGVPDNGKFYEEVVAGFLRERVENEGSAGGGSVKSLFSRWDGLRLERVVGSERVKGLLSGKGDTFDFV